MFEFLTTNPVLALLKKDHDTVKDLFDRFEKAEGWPAKKKTVRLALTELKVHAAIEEELFYPAVRKPVGKDIMNEADEGHHVAKVLIAELEGIDGREDHYDAKFKVLAENVRHHRPALAYRAFHARGGSGNSTVVWKAVSLLAEDDPVGARARRRAAHLLLHTGNLARNHRIFIY